MTEETKVKISTVNGQYKGAIGEKVVLGSSITDVMDQLEENYTAPVEKDEAFTNVVDFDNVTVPTVNPDSEMGKTARAMDSAYGLYGAFKNYLPSRKELWENKAQNVEVELTPARLEAMRLNPKLREIFEENVAVGEIDNLDRALEILLVTSEEVKKIAQEALNDSYTNGYENAQDESEEDCDCYFNDSDCDCDWREEEPDNLLYCESCGEDLDEDNCSDLDLVKNEIQEGVIDYEDLMCDDCL